MCVCMCVRATLKQVGTKSDLEKRRTVEAAEGQALALELGAQWMETSSLTGSGGAAPSAADIDVAHAFAGPAD
jgi:hypothetical protein